MEWLWFFETWFLPIVFIVVSETVRAVMECKCAVKKRLYFYNQPVNIWCYADINSALY